MLALPSTPDGEVTSTSRPWSLARRWGRAACAHQKLAHAEVRDIWNQTSGGVSSSRLATPPAKALWTMTSSPPKRSTVSATHASIGARSVTSVTMHSAVPPAARMASATGSPVAARRAAMTTLAPSAASLRAMPSPTPWPAPVTMATRPSS